MTNNKITIRAAISLIKKSLKDVNQDSRLTNKFVYSKLISKTSFIISQYADKLSLTNVLEAYQTLPCLKIIEVDSIEECNLVCSSFRVYRTECKLPEMYYDSINPIIKSIRTLDNSQSITLTTIEYIELNNNDTDSKYDKSIYAYFQNGYLYLTKKVPIKVIGMFISDVSSFDCECNKDQPCTKFLDSIWYVPIKIRDLVLQQVIQDLGGIYKKIPEDVILNKNPNQ